MYKINNWNWKDHHKFHSLFHKFGIVWYQYLQNSLQKLGNYLYRHYYIKIYLNNIMCMLNCYCQHYINYRINHRPNIIYYWNSGNNAQSIALHKFYFKDNNQNWRIKYNLKLIQHRSCCNLYYKDCISLKHHINLRRIKLHKI